MPTAKLVAFPLAVASAIVPLLVRLWVCDDPPKSLEPLASGLVLTDLYGRWKALLTITVAALTVLALVIGRRFATRVAPTRFACVVAAILAVLVIASSILSPFQDLAWMGLPTQHEGAVVMLAYLGLFLGASSLSGDGRARGLLIGALGCGAILLVVLGLSELYGVYPLESEQLRPLIMAPEHRESFHFYDVRLGGIATSLANRNYTGSYGALVWPLMLIFAVYAARSTRV